MAFITGTAANHTALWTTLLNFLQTDSTLVAAGQNWSVEWTHATLPELVLKGPGLAGTDEVLVGLKRTDNTMTATESAIWLTGMTGVIPSATSYLGHVNCLSRTPLMFIDQNPMTYWIVANGRRFVVVVKMSTVYNMMYGGLFLPYAQPAAYPLPLFIGGSRGLAGYSTSYVPITWRSGAVEGYRSFVYPRSNDGGSSWYDTPACMLRPDGTWAGITSLYYGNVYSLPRCVAGPRAFPYYLGSNPDTDCIESWTPSNPVVIGYESVRARLMAGLNGEMAVTPITLMQFNNIDPPAPITYGILDGCFAVTGVGNSAENIVTIGGVDHLVVPNVMRTLPEDYWALALE